MNIMHNIRIEKITLNMGIGQAGDRLEKAQKLLEKIAEAKAIQTKAVKRIPTWGLRPGLPIGCKVTLRGKKAEELMKRLLAAVENKINLRKFTGETVSFGISEYIDIPGVKYEVEVGIIGLEVAVTLERCGFRIKRRAIKRAGVGKKHRITSAEAVEFMKSRFNVMVE